MEKQLIAINGQFTTDIITIQVAEVKNVTANSAVLKVKAISNKKYDLKYKIQLWDYNTTEHIHDFTSKRISSGTELEDEVEGLNPITTYRYAVNIYYGDTNVEVAYTYGDFYTFLANSPPEITMNKLQSEYNQKFIISAAATDVDGDPLCFKLYTSTNKDTGYEMKAEKWNITSGQEVTLDSGEYITENVKYWYIEVYDGPTHTESSKQSVYWCKGKTEVDCTCWTSGSYISTYTELYYCDNCNSSWEGETVTCSNCDYYFDGTSCPGCGSGAGIGESGGEGCSHGYEGHDPNCQWCYGSGTYSYECDHLVEQAHAVVGN